MMRGGEAIIESLKNMGVKTIFGYPGGQTIPFYDMLYDSDINHILVRHEQCAAHAADGYARASGEVGVCLATSGPGATNLVTGIATAYMDSSPIVAITGQVPTHLIGNDAFQEADIIGITMPITKHSFQPKNPDLLPSIIKSSFEIAASGRPGPIIIDVPKEVQEGELTVFNDSLIQTPGYNPTIKGNIRQIRKAAELIKKAKRPLILAGSGVILANASVELKRFAEIINAPLLIKSVRNRINICLRRHRLMISRIENGNHRCIRHQIPANGNSFKIGRTAAQHRHGSRGYEE